jgi:SAM-dependent methyltransferase
MGFDVAAEAYDRFMGRYSVQLAPALADFAGVHAGQRALDVGCGPGALTSELVRRLGAAAVAAVDPSEPFVAAARERHPGVDVRRAPGESLPFEDAGFDVAAAQLVFHFLKDPVAGAREMARVTRAGGVVAACVWDLGGGRAPISPFWRSARELDPTPGGEGQGMMAGAREGQLAGLLTAGGVREVVATELGAAVPFETFDEWWGPFTLGVGPAGDYAQRIGPERLAALRERCREKLGDGPFVVNAVAWAARGIV